MKKSIVLLQLGFFIASAHIANGARCDVPILVRNQTAHLKLMYALLENPPSITRQTLRFHYAPDVLAVRPALVGFPAASLYFAPLPPLTLKAFNYIAGLFNVTGAGELESTADTVSVLEKLFPEGASERPPSTRWYGFSFGTPTLFYERFLKKFPEIQTLLSLAEMGPATPEDPDLSIRLAAAAAPLRRLWPPAAIPTVLIRLERWLDSHPERPVDVGRFLVDTALDQESLRSLATIGVISWLAGSGPISAGIGEILASHGFRIIPFFSPPTALENFTITVQPEPGNPAPDIVLRSDYIFSFLPPRRLQLLQQISDDDLAAIGLDPPAREDLLARIQTLAQHRTFLGRRDRSVP